MFFGDLAVINAEVGRGYAIIEVATVEDGQKALKLNGRRVAGRVVTVELSTRPVKAKGPVSDEVEVKKVSEPEGVHKSQDFFRNMFT